jgi:hypothetical protein
MDYRTSRQKTGCPAPLGRDGIAVILAKHKTGRRCHSVLPAGCMPGQARHDNFRLGEEKIPKMGPPKMTLQTHFGVRGQMQSDMLAQWQGHPRDSIKPPFGGPENDASNPFWDKRTDAIGYANTLAGPSTRQHQTAFRRPENDDSNPFELFPQLFPLSRSRERGRGEGDLGIKETKAA